MKFFLVLSLILGSLAFIVPTAAEAKSTATVVTEPQIRVQIGPQRRANRRVRSVIETRIVRRGNRTFRETYRITYLRNGRTNQQLISRVLIRRY